MEQRKSLRFPVNFRSSFSSIGMVGGEGSLVDLSIRGCRIESPVDVQPGASLEVRIKAIEHEPPIQIQAAIVQWSRGREFGLEFEVISSDRMGPPSGHREADRTGALPTGSTAKRRQYLTGI